MPSPTAALVSYVVARLAFRRLRLPFFWLWAAISSPWPPTPSSTPSPTVGPALAFLAPFDDTRYFFPWRPIVVSPIGRDILSHWGLRTIVSELVWVWTPTLALVGMAWLARPRGERRPA
jgi:hypothetical protein